MAKKTTTKWAVHKVGTAQFGYLCSFKSEAEQMLIDLKKSMYKTTNVDTSLYQVTEVQISWEECDMKN